MICCLLVSWEAKDPAGNSILIDGVILVFKTRSCGERNIGLLEMLVIPKSVTSKKALIELHGIESCVTEKCFRIDQRVFGKEILQGWNQKL